LPRPAHAQAILIVAHGNTLRALIKHLEGIPDEEISELNIPTGIPLVYELNRAIEVVTQYYFGRRRRGRGGDARVRNQAAAA